MNRLLRTAAASTTGLLLAAGLAGSVFADEENFNTNIQTATNSAELYQASAAVSGDATALDDSVAASGGAFAIASATQVQTNVQVGANQVVVDGEFPPTEGDIYNDNFNSQDAANDALAEQAAAAVSGEAYAEDSSEAYTGGSAAEAWAAQIQTNVQVGINQAAIDLGGLMGGMNGGDDEE